MAGLAIGGLTILLALIGSALGGGAGCCNCLIPIGGGVLAVYLYTKNSSAPITPGDGAKLGAIAGAVGGLLYLIIGVPLSYFVSAAAVEAQLAQLRDRGMNFPEALSGLVLFFVVGLIAAIVYTILATIGGLIGAAIMGKNRPGGAAMPPPPPPAGGYGGGSGGSGYGT